MNFENFKVHKIKELTSKELQTLVKRKTEIIQQMYLIFRCVLETHRNLSFETHLPNFQEGIIAPMEGKKGKTISFGNNAKLVFNSSIAEIQTIDKRRNELLAMYIEAAGITENCQYDEKENIIKIEVKPKFTKAKEAAKKLNVASKKEEVKK